MLGFGGGEPRITLPLGEQQSRFNSWSLHHSMHEIEPWGEHDGIEPDDECDETLLMSLGM